MTFAGNSTPNRSHRSIIAKGNMVAGPFDAELLPKQIQVHRRRRIPHLQIKLLQDWNSSGLISKLESAFKVPIRFDISACFQNRAQSSFQAFLVSSPLVYLDISQ